MARKTVPRKKVKKESDAATESVEDVSDNERKNTAEDSKPAKRGRKAAAKNNSDQTEVNDEASSSTNEVPRKKVKNESNAATELVEDVSDNERKNTAEDSKPAKRGRKTVAKNNSKQTKVNDEASSSTNEVPRKRVKNESNAATESVEDVSDNERKNKAKDSKPAKRGRKAAAKNNSDETEVNDESSSTNEVKSKDSEKEDEEKPKKVAEGTDKGAKRKRGAKEVVDTAKQSKPTNKKEKKSDSTKKPKNKTSSEFSTIVFTNESKSPAGNPWNLKISSWNINGLRAWLEKDGISYLHHEKPDILCVQETKCSDSNLPEEMKNVEGYHTYWLSGDKDGYSGVGLLSKEKPKNIEYGIGVSEHDNEGRVITAEYEDFYLVGTYVPNAGRGLVRLDYRQKWDEDFRAYLKKLDSEKPVILCGDLNVAHEEIDLANPKTNKKNAGFTKEEREGFSNLLKEGFVDTFRRLYPDVKGAYTFWTYMMNARGKNVGWRLDYFVLSERLCEKLCDNVIRKDVFGSDHCPITLFLSL